ncbi:MAG: glycerophosphodiester phosphodiesterase [Bacteroidota bacterium]
MLSERNLPSPYNDDGGEFFIIAHRGASAYYPENTMIAFEKAVELGANMIEIDIALSKDGVPVIFHDAKLNQHTNGKGRLRNFTLQELKKLDAGSWYSARYSGQKIPTLEEVLAFASGTIALNIEIKPVAVSNNFESGIEQKALQLVKKYNMENHVLFSSFDYRALHHLKELGPEIPVALLYEKKQSRKLLPNQLVKKYQVDAFNCSIRQLKKKWIADLNEHQIPSFIYTVDKKSQMRKLIKAGVVGIFTNKPNVLREVVKEFYPTNH